MNDQVRVEFEYLGTNIWTCRLIWRAERSEGIGSGMADALKDAVRRATFQSYFSGEFYKFYGLTITDCL